MAMPSQLRALSDRFIEVTTNDVLLTLSEGFVKVRVIETALSLGCTVQEGAGRRWGADVADYAVPCGGKILWRRAPRRLPLENGSSDVAVVEPFEMLLEIKTRPDHGTKSQAQFRQMDADVARVAENTKCAPHFVFDARIYLSFCGENTEQRGRHSNVAHWLVHCFPSLDLLPHDRWLFRRALRGPVHLQLGFRRRGHRLSADTITVFGAREDSSVYREAV